MLQAIKRLTKHTIVYGIGHILGRMIGFLLLPIHSNSLEPEQYGIATLLFSALAMLNVAFSYGMDIAFLRFFILEKSDEKKKQIFSTAFFIILITGILFSILILFNRSFVSTLIYNSPDFQPLIMLAAGILLADALTLIPFMVLRAIERSATFITVRMINVFTNVGLNILFVVILKFSVIGIFYANIIASAVTLIALMPVTIQWIKPVFKTSILKDLLLFGLPYVPSGLALLIMEQIGRFFIDRMISTAATGLFSAAYKLGMFMALLVAAFRFAWQPFFLSMTEKKEAPQVFSRILTYYMLIAGFVYLGITFFLQEIIQIRIGNIYLIQPEYHAGVGIVPLVLLGYVGYGAYVNFVVGVYIKKKTILLPVVTAISAVVSILGNIIFIPKFGLMGAAFSIMIAYWTMGVVMYCINHKLYPISYEWLRLVRVFTLAVFFIVIKVFAPIGDDIVFRIVLLLLYPVILWLSGFFYQDEKNVLRRTFKF